MPRFTNRAASRPDFNSENVVKDADRAAPRGQRPSRPGITSFPLQKTSHGNDTQICDGRLVAKTGRRFSPAESYDNF